MLHPDVRDKLENSYVDSHGALARPRARGTLIESKLYAMCG